MSAPDKDKIVYSMEIVYVASKRQFQSNVLEFHDTDSELLTILKHLKVEFDRLFAQNLEPL